MLRPLFALTVFLLISPYKSIACVEFLQLKGEFIQGGLLYGKLSSVSNKLFLNNLPVPTASNGIFVLGFDRDAPAQMVLRMVDSKDVEQCNQSIQIKRRQYQIQEINGLPHHQVHPNAASLKRIRQESAAVREARAYRDLRVDFLSGFDWPVIGPISGVYGSQRILNGEPRRPHYGVDVAAPVGTPVYAPAPGKVTLQHPDMYFSGGTIILDHGLGLSSSFLHLHEVLVSRGQIVQKGELIGKVGATGRVTGAHLDWRMNWQGAYIDPQRLVEPMPSLE